MEKAKTVPVSIDQALAGLSFLPDRSPTTDGEEDYFARLTGYRDGSMFVAWYAGNSEWERHSTGDEIVLCLEGATTLVVLDQGVETPHRLEKSEFLIVPRGRWHRFETPDGVKVMSVTPEPTDHQVERPDN